MKNRIVLSHSYQKRKGLYLVGCFVGWLVVCLGGCLVG